MPRKGVSRRHGIGAPPPVAAPVVIAEVSEPIVQAPPAPVVVAQPASDQRTSEPVRLDRLARGKNLNDMHGDDLRKYARLLGLTPRDAETLGEDRLRQNCRIRLVQLIDEM